MLKFDRTQQCWETLMHLCLLERTYRFLHLQILKTRAISEWKFRYHRHTDFVQMGVGTRLEHIHLQLDCAIVTSFQYLDLPILGDSCHPPESVNIESHHSQRTQLKFLLFVFCRQATLYVSTWEVFFSSSLPLQAQLLPAGAISYIAP